jgi:molybdopterin/thiamine biosynthesis adenylyltransferase/rhodanese-related sulfurtransferase
MDARYSRQVALPGFGPAAQAALGEARVLVIGAGGLGSAVLPALAAAGVGTNGVGTIGVIDDDRVELSNLHRQHIHRTDAVGTSKVASATATLAAINPGVRVTAHEQRLTPANALELFAAYDLVVDGSDNFPTRYLASDAAVLTGKPVVWGAVSQYGGQASVTLAGGPGYRDLFPTPPPPGTVPSCEVGGVLPTTVGVVGSIMATEALKLITGIGEPLSGRVTTYDALGGGFREVRFERDPAGEAITGLIDYEAFCREDSTGSASEVGSTSEAGPTSGSRSSITAAELAADEDVVLIDVRETWEAEIASLPGALLIPLGTLEAASEILDPQAPIVVYCHHGIRSARALELLRARGFSHVRHLEGGIEAWAVSVDREMARY